MDEFADDPPVERRVGERLREREETVAVAEAATGGLVTTLLTGPPGASDYLDRAWVPYAYDALREQLAVSRETLDEHGAVSGPTVEEMARAARDRARTDWGIGVAAIAGPAGESQTRPVGTAFAGIARAAPWGSEASTTRVQRYIFDGDRGEVREQVARETLDDLLAALERP